MNESQMRRNTPLSFFEPQNLKSDIDATVPEESLSVIGKAIEELRNLPEKNQQNTNAAKEAIEDIEYVIEGFEEEISAKKSPIIDSDKSEKNIHRILNSKTGKVNISNDGIEQELDQETQNFESIKHISPQTMQYLKAVKENNEKEHIPFDSGIENLLEIARTSESVAKAIERNPSRMVECFNEIVYRYALVKENPNNHTSLIHYIFGIPMEEIVEKRNFFLFFKKTQVKKNVYPRYTYTASSLRRDILERLSFKEIKRYLGNDAYFLRNSIGSNNPVVVVTFDKFGNLNFRKPTEEENKELEKVSF